MVNTPSPLNIINHEFDVKNSVFYLSFAMKYGIDFSGGSRSAHDSARDDDEPRAIPLGNRGGILNGYLLFPPTFIDNITRNNFLAHMMTSCSVGLPCRK